MVTEPDATVQTKLLDKTLSGLELATALPWSEHFTQPAVYFLVRTVSLSQIIYCILHGSGSRRGPYLYGLRCGHQSSAHSRRTRGNYRSRMRPVMERNCRIYVSLGFLPWTDQPSSRALLRPIVFSVPFRVDKERSALVPIRKSLKVNQHK